MSDVKENFEIPNQFPIGMRVLAVDHDQTCLDVLQRFLTNCQFQVTMANKSKLALDYVRDKKNKFDLVITQIEMPDMNAFNLLELITLENDIPVIMISNNINAELMAKAIRHGAYFVLAKSLTKPLTIEMLKNTCLYAYTKHKIEKETCNGKIDTSENVSDASVISKSKRKIDDLRINKNRTVWTDYLHGIFIEAIDKLKENEEKVVPKNILKKMEEMEVKYLSRANVASHLQKHRLKDSFNFLQTTVNINRKTRIGMPARRPKTHLPQKSYKNFPLQPITVDQSGQLINNTIPPIHASRTCSQIPPNDIRKYQQVPSYANQSDAGKYQQVPSYANQSDAGKNQQVLSYANQCDVGKYQQISSDVNHQLGNIGLSGPLDNFDDLFSYNDNNNNGLPVSAAPSSFLAGNNQESVLSHEFSGFNLSYSHFEMGNVDTNLTGLYRNRNMSFCDDLVMKPAGELNPRTDDSVSVNNSNLRGKENQNQVQSGYEDLSFINDFLYNRRNK